MHSTATRDASHVNFEFQAPGEDLLKKPDLALQQLYDWNATNNPDYPLFVFADGRQRRYITYSAANEAINRAARYALSSVGPNVPGEARKLITVLANTDTITYFCTAVGLLRAGLPVFLVSTRNAPLAVADMIQRTGATHIFLSGDSPMQALGKGALASLAESGVHVIEHAMPVFEDLFAETADPSSPFEAAVELPSSYDMSETSIIMHSSGSSGHPKPIAWTHARTSYWGRGAAKSDVPLTRTVSGCHGTPMFHGMGSFMYSASPVVGLIVAVFKPASPPTVPTPEAVWEGIVATGTTMSFCVPSFIEQWARDPEKVVYMKTMKGLMFGGAALNDEVGNALAVQGVKLFSVYGLTETGLINTLMRPNPGMDWSYWTVNRGVDCSFRPIGDGTYEVIVISPPDLPLPKVNTKVGEFDGYATNDLVVPHPTISGMWKIVGRADEQIMLSNGEKTNPIPLEKMINDDPHVKGCVMFGRGKFQNGVLVEPTEEYTVLDPSDAEQVAAFRNMIWSTIEEVNAFAPQHSRIFKEMILITHPSKPLQFNVKGLPRRGVILAEYHDEIEDLYKAVENSAESDVPPPAAWDVESTLTYVRAVVESTLQRSIPDDADIFRSGGDSLQATWIRNTILGAIRQTNPSAAKRLPMNVAFAFPTIAALAEAVSGVASGTDDASSRTPQDLWKYVERFSADLPARPAQLSARPAGQKDVVLITGTTGGFGCDALEHLLRDETVGRVYAFNRPNSQAAERQRAQFRARGLDETLLDSGKLVMVEAALHEPGFGIDSSLLEEIRGSVTHIMLNAWKVNFNMSIASFEVDIQAARNFVDLSFSSPYTVPPTIVFVSSVGVFSNCELTPPVPEVPLVDPKSAFGTGYSESKWVTEHILQTVTEKTGVRTVVMRLGQVTSNKLGYWNEKEWFPSLVKTALHQRCLPQVEGLVSWFPAYEAAKAFAEMRHSSEPILHLVHPRPVQWNALLTPIAETLGVPLVSYDEWITALSTSVTAGSADEVEAMTVNPALRLLPFYQAQKEVSASDREAMGLVILSTEKATRVSPTLAALPQLDASRAVSWVAAWKKAGFL